jgi:hypothetical protein
MIAISDHTGTRKADVTPPTVCAKSLSAVFLNPVEQGR